MGGGQSMPQQEAKHLATIDCGDGFMVSLVHIKFMVLVEKPPRTLEPR